MLYKQIGIIVYVTKSKLKKPYDFLALLSMISIYHVKN